MNSSTSSRPSSLKKRGLEASANPGWTGNQDLRALLRIDPAGNASDERSDDDIIELNPEFSLARVKLESVLRVMPVRIRSLGPDQQQARQQLKALADRYMRTRESMKPGSERTAKMNGIVLQISPFVPLSTVVLLAAFPGFPAWLLSPLRIRGWLSRWLASQPDIDWRDLPECTREP